MGTGAPGQLYFAEYAMGAQTNPTAPSVETVVGSRFSPVAATVFEPVRGVRLTPVPVIRRPT